MYCFQAWYSWILYVMSCCCLLIFLFKQHWKPQVPPYLPSKDNKRNERRQISPLLYYKSSFLLGSTSRLVPVPKKSLEFIVPHSDLSCDKNGLFPPLATFTTQLGIGLGSPRYVFSKMLCQFSVHEWILHVACKTVIRSTVVMECGPRARSQRLDLASLTLIFFFFNNIG